MVSAQGVGTGLAQRSSRGTDGIRPTIGGNSSTRPIDNAGRPAVVACTWSKRGQGAGRDYTRADVDESAASYRRRALVSIGNGCAEELVDALMFVDLTMVKTKWDRRCDTRRGADALLADAGTLRAELEPLPRRGDRLGTARNYASDAGVSETTSTKRVKCEGC